MASKAVKLLPIMLLSLMVLSGCSVNNGTGLARDPNTSAAVTPKTVTIAASFYPIYISTLNIAKDITNVKVIDMTKNVQGCLHDYSITTGDMKNLEGAQFFIINGAGMESFMDKVTSQMPDLKIIESGKGISLIRGAGEKGDNPHVWVSISNAIMQVKNIGEQLAVLDPGNAAKYKANTDKYIKKLEAERDKMHKALEGIKNRDIITFHEAFSYFAREFDLNIVGVIEREPGSEPDAKEMDETIAKVKDLKVGALFAEPQYSTKAIEIIAKETGAKVYILDPAVTGPMDIDAYINIMESNLKSLKEALK